MMLSLASYVEGLCCGLSEGSMELAELEDF